MAQSMASFALPKPPRLGSAAAFKLRYAVVLKCEGGKKRRDETMGSELIKTMKNDFQNVIVTFSVIAIADGLGDSFRLLGLTQSSLTLPNASPRRI